ncbi:MAG: hypothetical protein EOO59_05780 [Hymenobacter sp.]|nr:MAG: hypothetical protein EOO59_05780 [Hymenobacter sp.]
MKLLLWLALGFGSLPAFAQRPPNPRLRHELDSIRRQDQRYRRMMARLREGRADSLAAALAVPASQVSAYAAAAMQRADSSNLRRVEEIIWRYGYPGQTLVGRPTNEVAWRVLQHSTKIPQYLIWVKGAAEAGEIPFRLYAEMLDRKLMDDDQEQVYGTQWAGYTVLDHETGKQHTIGLIWPIRDPQRVDKRRREAGFATSLAESSDKLGIPYIPVTLDYALWLQQEAVELLEMQRK